VAGHRLNRPESRAPVPIEGYLEELAARLRGPRRRRGLVLAELRDGLDCAIAEQVAAGLPADRAVMAAIRDFGAPEAVAGAFACELATAYARRAVAWYVATGPFVGIWWLLLLQPKPWRTGVAGLIAAIPVIPLIAIAVAVAAGTCATTGRLVRWLPEARPRRAVDATITVAAMALAGDTTVIARYTWAGGAWQPLAIVAFAWSLVRIGCSLGAVRAATAIRQSISSAESRKPAAALAGKLVKADTYERGHLRRCRPQHPR
jgi:roadblock/LC7 domain-containing protein